MREGRVFFKTHSSIYVQVPSSIDRISEIEGLKWLKDVSKSIAP